MPRKPKNPYRKMLDKLQTKGWIQGNLHRETPRKVQDWRRSYPNGDDVGYCLVGAALTVEEIRQELRERGHKPRRLQDLVELQSELLPELFEVLAEQWPGFVTGQGLVHFNDHAARTKDEIIAVLEKAAIRLDEQIA